jgi:tRNA guanosine-2'-O-methyltransferase
VVIGYLVKKNPSLLRPWRQELVTCCLPWFLGASGKLFHSSQLTFSGLSRAIAQYVVHEIFSSLHEDNSVRDPLLVDIVQFLNENKDIIKLRKKQIAFFEAYELDSKCSVSGILSIPMDHWGEHIPEHILEILTQAIKGNLLQSGGEIESRPTSTPTNQPLPTITSMMNAEDLPNMELHPSGGFQTKIIPFDELQLTIETLRQPSSSAASSQQRNHISPPRQEMIVCASLLDKVTNLAGIARTCEIFSVRELIIPDLKVLQSEDFQTMSVASSNWLPIREIFVPNTSASASTSSSSEGYVELISYLREMKRRGYQIVGVEQTGGSVSLESAVIQSQCVIVLGREKEGIPVELLNEMDLCVEIPQYGVTRSLNVHVSASLVIWEITKKNIASGRL